MPAPSGSGSSPPPAAPPPGAPLRVLVVEDDPDSAEALRDVLELSGHRVEVASDGEEALARAEAGAPDVVLCDLHLGPGIGGLEVGRLLRPRLPGARLVAMTGVTSREVEARVLEAGFDALVPKPLQWARLEPALHGRPPRRP